MVKELFEVFYPSTSIFECLLDYEILIQDCGASIASPCQPLVLTRPSTLGLASCDQTFYHINYNNSIEVVLLLSSLYLASEMLVGSCGKPNLLSV